ncbi:potassium transporter [Artemisia annua]|uniref:Potassium transporter n=1 Tax=Artemisia annua TaxID=35608 RepID=A0A2U1L9D9_ARTAN|nr:potassium transporter [Artemisia annua]
MIWAIGYSQTDERLTTYIRTPIHENSFAAKTKGWLEAHALKKNTLLLLVLVGTCMVIRDGILTPAISGKSPRDGILTPAISVLSASGGLKVNHPGMRNENNGSGRACKKLEDIQTTTWPGLNAWNCKFATLKDMHLLGAGKATCSFKIA